MLDKTRATNENILTAKANATGGFYTTPESLSASISTQARDKKAQEAALRKQLTEQVRNE